MVLWNVIGQEELDKSLREGVGLPRTGRSLQERKIRKGKGRIFFQDGMGHSFHFDRVLRFEPLDLLEPTEGKAKKLEDTRIKRGFVIKPDKPFINGFDPRHSLFRRFGYDLLIARGGKKNLFFQFLLLDLFDFYPVNRA